MASASAPREVVMPRPSASTGTTGRGIELQANFFPAEFKGLNAIYQWDVAIITSRRTPGAPRNADPVDTDVAPVQPIAVNRRIFRRFLHQKGLAGVAYDGRKIAYSASEMPEEGLGVRLMSDREGNEAVGPRAGAYTVKFIKSGAVDGVTLRKVLLGGVGAMDEGVQAAINALDVVLSEGNSLRYVEVGRSFYSDANCVDLGGGAQAWRGFYQSFRLTKSGLRINVDESFTPFWMTGTLVELCTKASGGRLPNNVGGWRKLGKDLHSLRVRNVHTGITYRVFGFTEGGARATTFLDSTTNSQVSVANYMQNTYGVRLQSPELPCVRTAQTGRPGAFIPLEMLTVCENQRLAKAMTPQQTSMMIRAAALKPDKRQESAQRSIATASYNKDATCQAFGLSVDPQMLTVKARILNVPFLEYRGNAKMQPRDGAWNMAKNKVHLGVTVFHWIVIQIGSYMQKQGPQGTNNLVQELVKVGSENGVTFNDPSPEQFNVASRLSQADYEKYLTELIDWKNQEIRKVKDQESHRLQLVVILKEKQDSVIYNTTKRVCDIKKGVASQCLLSTVVVKQRRLDQYVSNVLLKINVKLGGYNVKVAYSTDPKLKPKFLNAPHIVLGADVSHPAPGGGRPSVAAVVGSYDRFGMQYTGALRNQKCRQEVIQGMEEMFLEVYRRWFNHFRNPQTGVGVHADAIIMFRDGVSEGQYQQVMDHEVSAIRRACREKCKINPKITYVIVTKRHHARFFGTRRTSHRDLDRNKNIVAGTVIDTDITSSNFYDFFLNSHAGIQGTNRPSKYTVLIDENFVTADQLQNYIFSLSHGFARCTRSVSMVNSAYYAHVLAARGRTWLDDDGSDIMSVSSAGGDIDAVVPLAGTAHANIAHRLWFV